MLALPMPAWAGEPARPNLVLGPAVFEEEGDRIRVVIQNLGAGGAGPFEVRVTTRGAGRVIGTALHAVPGLAAGETRDHVFPISLFGGGVTALLRSLAGRCCVSELEVDPAGEVEESDEADNRLRLSHPPPRAQKPALRMIAWKRSSSR
ncbi:MAG: CARDB domain-containing protein [Myxococcota bacterium]|nr:CARDB domain-containing protein [Myxococcota bacterium]